MLRGPRRQARRTQVCQRLFGSRMVWGRVQWEGVSGRRRPSRSEYWCQEIIRTDKIDLRVHRLELVDTRPAEDGGVGGEGKQTGGSQVEKLKTSMSSAKPDPAA